MSSPFSTFGDYAALREKLRHSQCTADYFALIRKADRRITIGPPLKRAELRDAEISLRGSLPEALKGLLGGCFVRAY
jgi:hypothetical protein